MLKNLGLKKDYLASRFRLQNIQAKCREWRTKLADDIETDIVKEI